MAGNNEIYTGIQNYYTPVAAAKSEGEETQKESISFQKHRSRLKSERGTKEKRPSNEKEWRRVYIYTRNRSVINENEERKKVLQYYDLGKTLVFRGGPFFFSSHTI